MDLASGVCHYCTVGLPPEKLFYLYIPSGCLDSSLLSQTEGDSCHRRSLQCSWSGLHYFVQWQQIHRHDRAITWRQQATYCVGTLSYGLHVMAGVWAPCLLGCVLYIYINALQHFNIFYRTKGNRRITRTRQSMHFSQEHQKYSQAFCEGTYPPVSFMYWHSSSACSHFLSRNFKYLLMYTHNYYFDTLKDFNTILFKTLILELHTKKIWIKLLLFCKPGLPDRKKPWTGLS